MGRMGQEHHRTGAGQDKSTTGEDRMGQERTGQEQDSDHHHRCGGAVFWHPHRSQYYTGVSHCGAADIQPVSTSCVFSSGTVW